MRSREPRKQKRLKRVIVCLFGVVIVFSLIYLFIGMLKDFGDVNVASGSVNAQQQIKKPKNGTKEIANDDTNLSNDMKSPVEKPNEKKENIQTDPINPDPESDVIQTNNKQPSGKNQKVVYLTFDDGPSELTHQFLDVLNREQINATFFMVGDRINRYPNEVKRAVTEGNYVGAHSMTHDYHSLYKENQFVLEMQQTISIIKQVTGEDTTLVRAPYGSKPGLNLGLRNDSVEAGFKIWDWSVDTQDWRDSVNSSKVVNEVRRQTTKNIEVILFHENQSTLDALPEIINYLRTEEYEIKVYNPDEHFPLNFWDDGRL